MGSGRALAIFGCVSAATYKNLSVLHMRRQNVPLLTQSEFVRPSHCNHITDSGGWFCNFHSYGNTHGLEFLDLAFKLIFTWNRHTP